MTSLQLAFESRLIVRSVRSDPNLANVLALLRASPEEDLRALCPVTKASLLFFVAQRPNDEEAEQLCRLLCDELKVCNPLQCDRNLQTALFFAARDGNSHCVSYFLSRGCSPNHRDTARQTALFYSARDGRTKVVGVLLDAGADVNSVDHLGQTALFYASRDGRLETVALMLERGANTQVRDRHRRTASYYAQRNSHKELVALLSGTTEAGGGAPTPGGAISSGSSPKVTSGPGTMDSSSVAHGVGSPPLGAAVETAESETAPGTEQIRPLKRARVAPKADPLASEDLSGPGASLTTEHGTTRSDSPRPSSSQSGRSGEQSTTTAAFSGSASSQKRLYRLCLNRNVTSTAAAAAAAAAAENSNDASTLDLVPWVSAPLEQIELLERLVPSVAGWSTEATCHVSSIFHDCRAKWQTIANEILSELIQVKDGWIFSKPVDCKTWGCPDYYDVILHPMDFSTIRKKFKSFKYTRCADFVDDMKLIFSNCFRYNKPDSDVAATGRNIERLFNECSEKRGLRAWLDKEAELETWYTEFKAAQRENLQLEGKIIECNLAGDSIYDNSISKTCQVFDAGTTANNLETSPVSSDLKAEHAPAAVTESSDSVPQREIVNEEAPDEGRAGSGAEPDRGERQCPAEDDGGAAADQPDCDESQDNSPSSSSQFSGDENPVPISSSGAHRASSPRGTNSPQTSGTNLSPTRSQPQVLQTH